MRLLAPPTPQIPVGFVSDYIGNQPRRFSVPMLKVSTLIQRRERSISEDTIYVRRESDGFVAACYGVFCPTVETKSKVAYAGPG